MVIGLYFSFLKIFPNKMQRLEKFLRMWHNVNTARQNARILRDRAMRIAANNSHGVFS